MPPSEAEEPKGYVIARLREALARDGRVNELDIEITVAGNKVFLSGDVATPERRDAILRVAQECLPGYDIHNEVAVTQLADAEAEPLS